MDRKKSQAIIALMMGISTTVFAQVDFAAVQVNQEAGLNLVRITNDNDNVCMPQVKRHGQTASWFTNRIIDVSVDGESLAFLSTQNGTTNIFIKDMLRLGGSVKRTNRSAVVDFSYSPDGKYICFTESEGRFSQIYQTDARTGYICRQITNNAQDYSPVYSPDMQELFFTRLGSPNGSKGASAGIWSYSFTNNYLSSYTQGINPQMYKSKSNLLCTRMSDGRGQIWSVDFVTGVEECIVSDPYRSFSTPSLSPDGNWIVMVGTTTLMNGSSPYTNTDIFVCRTDGTQLSQLTYHAADDLSPVWSRDGKHILFISQRGSSSARANVWRIDFNY